MFTDGRITTRIRGVDEIWQLSVKLNTVTVFLTGIRPFGLNNSKLILSQQTSAHKVQKRFCFHSYLSVFPQDITLSEVIWLGFGAWPVA